MSFYHVPMFNYSVKYFVYLGNPKCFSHFRETPSGVLEVYSSFYKMCTKCHWCCVFLITYSQDHKKEIKSEEWNLRKILISFQMHGRSPRQVRQRPRVQHPIVRTGHCRVRDRSSSCRSHGHSRNAVCRLHFSSIWSGKFPLVWPQFLFIRGCWKLTIFVTNIRQCFWYA